MAAGLHHWQTGTFDLYRVNPPLVRLVATAPLAALGVDLPSEEVDSKPPARPEFDLGWRLFDRLGGKAFWYLTLSRWACIPFALLATAVIYAWARALYGPTAGLLSAALWVVCPTALGNAQMITPDTGAATLGLLACYLFRRWLRRPGWGAALLAGAALGLAELCKTTWVLLVPAWAIAWAVTRTGAGRPGWRAECGQLATSFLTALYVLNVGYGFEATGTRLGQFRFTSRALTTEVRGRQINRFAGTAVAELPVPVPRNYIEGVDVQKRDFEAGMRSYLRGEWRTDGWWYYYLYGLAVKTPLGTLAVFALAVASRALPGGPRLGWREEFVVLLPGLAVLALVSSQTGLNHHLRYVLPALPFLFVWAGRAATYAGPLRRTWRAGLAAAAIAAAASSLAVYPHSLSYFNEAAGGPRQGPKHLVDSNVDWGQNLLHLRRWMDEHPDARPIHLAYFGYIDPRAAGITFSLPPEGPVTPTDLRSPRADALGPHPGWHAISVNFLYGYHYPVADGAGGVEFIGDHHFGYFLRSRPIGRAGYSIWIYHLDEAECDRIRAELGLPPLTAAHKDR